MGSGLVHPKGENSMAISGYGCHWWWWGGISLISGANGEKSHLTLKRLHAVLLKLHQSWELFLSCIEDNINYIIYVPTFWFYWNLCTDCMHVVYMMSYNSCGL